MSVINALSRVGTRNVRDTFICSYAKRLRIRSHAHGGSLLFAGGRACFSSVTMPLHVPSWSSREPSSTCLSQSRGSSYSTTKENSPQNQHKKKDNLSIAIVGTGPSGCYTAKYLISSIKQMQEKQLEKDAQENVAIGSKSGRKSEPSFIGCLKTLDIDMIDRLPTPFGLVRSGVAPDHQEVKNVENDFVKLFESNHDDSSTSTENSAVGGTGAGENDHVTNEMKSTMVFRGNVQVGKDVTLQELRDAYDIVVLAYGCESDRKLEAQTSEQRLKGIYSAREFVAWYNGHPDFVHMGKEFQSVLNGRETTPSNARVMIVGQGNVALDCARILAKGKKSLIDTDIASHALDVIGDGVAETTVLGRRGHIQGAFTIKEIRELTKLEDADFIVDEKELEMGATLASQEELKAPGGRPKVRIDKLLRDAATNTAQLDGSDNHHKKVKLRFMWNPLKFEPDPADPSKLGSVICERTELKGEAFAQTAVSTEHTEEIPANMALISIGYKGIKLPDMDTALFDESKGTVKNTRGKVDGNLFVSGWLKRGPSGIIGTNIADAKDTVASILVDVENIVEDYGSQGESGREDLDELLVEREVQVVDWTSYKKIDSAEKDAARLRTANQPREKFTDVIDMLNFR